MAVSAGEVMGEVMAELPLAKAGRREGWVSQGFGPGKERGKENVLSDGKRAGGRRNRTESDLHIVEMWEVTWRDGRG